VLGTAEIKNLAGVEQCGMNSKDLSKNGLRAQGRSFGQDYPTI
jgi:hypothetical protein